MTESQDLLCILYLREKQNFIPEASEPWMVLSIKGCSDLSLPFTIGHNSIRRHPKRAPWFHEYFFFIIA